MRRCFAASEAALLLGTPQLSVGLLERLVREYPNGKSPGMNLPVSVIANFRIGTAARYSGQSARALLAYQAAIAAADEMPDREQPTTGVRGIAMLYIAEILTAQGRSPEALEVLGRVAQLPPFHGMPADLYKQWAEAEIQAILWSKPGMPASTRSLEPLPSLLLLFL